MTKNRKIAYIAIIGNVIIWGAALPIVKPALEFVSPFYFLLIRYVIASLVLVPLIPFIKPKKLHHSDLLTIIALEFLQIIIGLSLLYVGLDKTTALEASLIASTSPILVTLGGIFILKEREDKNEWQGLITSVIGTFLVIIAPFLVHQEGFTFSPLGNFLVLGYNLCWMSYLLLAKRLYRRYNKIFITAVGSLVGLVGYTFILSITGFDMPLLDALQIPSVLLPALYMGILGSPIAVGLYLYGQTHIEASEATLFTYLQPLIYIPLSVLWLKDTLMPLQLVGLIIVAIGVFIAERRPRYR